MFYRMPFRPHPPLRPSFDIRQIVKAIKMMTNVIQHDNDL